MEKPKKATIKKNDPAQEAAAAKLNALSQAMEKIAKNFGRGAIMKLGDDNVEDVEVIPTGSIGLNFALGVGGFPADESPKSTVPNRQVKPRSQYTQ